MKDFKIKFKNGNKELDLEAGTIENSEDWKLIRGILSSFDIHTGDDDFDNKMEEVYNTRLKSYELGYQSLANEKGLHHPESEFFATSAIGSESKKEVHSATPTTKNQLSVASDVSADIKKPKIVDTNKSKNAEISSSNTTSSTIQKSNPTRMMHAQANTAFANAFKNAENKKTEETKKQAPIDRQDIRRNYDGYNIKRFNGEEKYQTYYICDNSQCGNRGKRFIFQEEKIVFCHKCNRKLNVRNADRRGFPNTDDRGNFFAAGEYKKV